MYISPKFYKKAAKQMGEGQPALLAALSAYNTGDMQKGFKSGYVHKYLSRKNEIN